MFNTNTFSVGTSTCQSINFKALTCLISFNVSKHLNFQYKYFFGRQQYLAINQSRIIWGFFPTWGGGSSQNFCKFTKSFLVCQIYFEVLKHVLHAGGGNIWSILSPKVHLIGCLCCSFREENELFWEFFPWGGGGSLIPKSIYQNICKMLTFWWKPNMFLRA